MNQITRELERDCGILLKRALKGKTLACFGVDGFGKYGQNDIARHYEVEEVLVDLKENNDSDYPDGIAIVVLTGYCAADAGYIDTDLNFTISLNKLLQKAEIDTSCWSFAEHRTQLECSVVLDLDVAKLVSW